MIPYLSEYPNQTSLLTIIAIIDPDSIADRRSLIMLLFGRLLWGGKYAICSYNPTLLTIQTIYP